MVTECNKLMHTKTLASLVYQCFSCTNVVGKIHMAWAKKTCVSCYHSVMLCELSIVMWRSEGSSFAAFLSSDVDFCIWKIGNTV